MDKRLFEASLTGNIEVLNQLIIENPLILEDVVITSSETPLHIASKVGHLNFVKEVLRRKPEFANEPNQDGYLPMDIAAAHGYVEIVRELLLTMGTDLCRQKGRDGRTPLHYASIKGRVDIINEILSKCPDSIADVTVLDESALHLAVKNNQIKAFKVILQFLEQTHKEEIVKGIDLERNTVLHLAASRKQHESLKLLLESSNISKMVEINATNSRGMTAMDILDIVIQSPHDLETSEMLRHAGAMSAQDVNTIPPHLHDAAIENPTINGLPPPDPSEEDTLDYFVYNRERDPRSETRNILLVVAALIVAATYQAGINPPGSVWQDDSKPGDKNPHTAGTAILSSKPTIFTLFMFFNTLGFSSSITMIEDLTRKFPFKWNLRFAMGSVGFTYGNAISNLSTPENKNFYLVIVAFFLPMIVVLVRSYLKPYWKRWRQPRSGNEEGSGV